MNSRRRATSLALLAAVALTGSGVAEAALPLQWLGRDDGLPSSQVHGVAQDALGYMWFAGPAGLARYDGRRVRRFDKSHGLATQGLRALSVDRSGRLLVGSDLGVDVLGAELGFRPLPGSEDWSFGFVEDIATQPDGSTWIATAGGLVVVRPGSGLETVPVPELQGSLVSAVTLDASGALWAVGPSTGLWRKDDSGWSRVAAGTASGPKRVVRADAEGSVYVAGSTGFAELDATTLELIAEEQTPWPVSALLGYRDELWVGVGSELRRYLRAPEGWRLEATAPAATLNLIAADAQGNIWVATDGLGVGKVTALRDAVVRIDLPQQVQVQSVRIGAQGALLVGGNGASWVASREDPARLRSLPRLDGIKVWDLMQDGSGRLWAATEEGLLVQDGSEPATRVRGTPELEAPNRVLLERETGVWVGGVSGLVAIEGSEPRSIGSAPLGYVYTLMEDAERRMWVGTIGGLWREGPTGELERVTAGGLSERGNVYAVAFGPNREVAVLQDDRILVRLADEWAVVPGGHADAIAGWSAGFDSGGRLWVGSDSGLTQYEPRSGRVLRHLTQTMGLSGSEFTTSRSLWIEGRYLYCGLTEGLTRVDSTLLASFDAAPLARLNQASWQQAELSREEAGLVVEPGHWTLHVGLSAAWLIDEHTLSYRHRLLGFDAEWSARARDGDQIVYTGLPAGDYALEAQAHSPLTGWGPGREVLSFRVRQHWWMRPWALALGAGSLAGLVLATHRLRTRALRRRARELHELVEQRTAELAAEKRKQEHLALHDELTGLPNRRSLLEQAGRLDATARRHQTAYAVIVGDLDGFKTTNDTRGHLAGDAVLRHTAERLRAAIREEDVAARYGGDEFVILMPATDASHALEVARRVRREVVEHPCRIPGEREIGVAISLGAAVWAGQLDCFEDVFERADRAALEAKRSESGVVLWNP